MSLRREKKVLNLRKKTATQPSKGRRPNTPPRRIAEKQKKNQRDSEKSPRSSTLGDGCLKKPPGNNWPRGKVQICERVPKELFQRHTEREKSLCWGGVSIAQFEKGKKVSSFSVMGETKFVRKN